MNSSIYQVFSCKSDQFLIVFDFPSVAYTISNGGYIVREKSVSWGYKRSNFLFKLKLVGGMLALMICFFNCGQPGSLGLKGPNESNSTLSDDPASPSSPIIPADPNNTGTISPPGINEVINNMKPALAVRGTGCIMCHSQINSNIITDFGNGGDGNGNNYFFGGFSDRNLPAGLTNTRGGSVYGDYDFSRGEDTNWGAATLGTNVKVIVPEASTLGLDIEESSLANYLKKILKQNPNASSAEVQEVKSVYIGAPTADKIVSVSGVATGTLKYFPSKSGSALVGITKNSNYFTNQNNQTIVCDGDVVISGVLYLNRAKIKSDSGCRFYVTGSVLVTGPITYIDATDKTNVQITSAKMVALGVGHRCDPNNAGEDYSDSINERLTASYSSNGRYSGFFTRNFGSPISMLYTLKADADLIGSNLKDASCGPEGRYVDFQRLMLNAPVVHNRYKGQYKGLIVAEIALLALKALKYEFDPVFSDPKVKILPLLKSSDFLEILK